MTPQPATQDAFAMSSTRRYDPRDPRMRHPARLASEASLPDLQAPSPLLPDTQASIKPWEQSRTSRPTSSPTNSRPRCSAQTQFPASPQLPRVPRKRPYTTLSQAQAQHAGGHEEPEPLHLGQDGMGLAAGVKCYHNVMDRHSGMVCGAAFSASGSHIITCSSRGTTTLWDASCDADGPLKSYREIAHSEKVMHCALSADGSRAVTACRDGTTRIWDIDPSVENIPPKTFSNSAFTHAHACQITPNGSTVLATMWHGARPRASSSSVSMYRTLVLRIDADSSAVKFQTTISGMVDQCCMSSSGDVIALGVSAVNPAPGRAVGNDILIWDSCGLERTRFRNVLGKEKICTNWDLSEDGDRLAIASSHSCDIEVFNSGPGRNWDRQATVLSDGGTERILMCRLADNGRRVVTLTNGAYGESNSIKVFSVKTCAIIFHVPNALSMGPKNHWGLCIEPKMIHFPTNAVSYYETRLVVADASQVDTAVLVTLRFPLRSEFSEDDCLIRGGRRWSESSPREGRRGASYGSREHESEQYVGQGAHKDRTNRQSYSQTYQGNRSELSCPDDTPQTAMEEKVQSPGTTHTVPSKPKNGEGSPINSTQLKGAQESSATVTVTAQHQISSTNVEQYRPCNKKSRFQPLESIGFGVGPDSRLYIEPQPIVPSAPPAIAVDANVKSMKHRDPEVFSTSAPDQRKDDGAAREELQRPGGDITGSPSSKPTSGPQPRGGPAFPASPIEPNSLRGLDNSFGQDTVEDSARAVRHRNTQSMLAEFIIPPSSAKISDDVKFSTARRCRLTPANGSSDPGCELAMTAKHDPVFLRRPPLGREESSLRPSPTLGATLPCSISDGPDGPSKATKIEGVVPSRGMKLATEQKRHGETDSPAHKHALETSFHKQEKTRSGHHMPGTGRSDPTLAAEVSLQTQHEIIDVHFNTRDRVMVKLSDIHLGGETERIHEPENAIRYPNGEELERLDAMTLAKVRETTTVTSADSSDVNHSNQTKKAPEADEQTRKACLNETIAFVLDAGDEKRRAKVKSEVASPCMQSLSMDDDAPPHERSQSDAAATHGAAYLKRDESEEKTTTKEICVLPSASKLLMDKVAAAFDEESCRETTHGVRYMSSSEAFAALKVVAETHVSLDCDREIAECVYNAVGKRNLCTKELFLQAFEDLFQNISQARRAHWKYIFEQELLPEEDSLLIFQARDLLQTSVCSEALDLSSDQVMALIESEGSGMLVDLQAFLRAAERLAEN